MRTRRFVTRKQLNELQFVHPVEIDAFVSDDGDDLNDVVLIEYDDSATAMLRYEQKLAARRAREE